MWLVSSRSPFLCEYCGMYAQRLRHFFCVNDVPGRSAHTVCFAASRDSMTGVGMIDWFFDNWLPIFVHEARRLKHLDAELIVNNKSIDDALVVSVSALIKHKQHAANAQHTATLRVSITYVLSLTAIHAVLLHRFLKKQPMPCTKR